MRKIFTLIELLIVISIIAILASMLMPALKSARDKAKELGCLSNLKQMGTANIMYANDYNDCLPFSKTHMELWDYQLMPYLNYPQNLTEASAKKNFSVFHCPSSTSTGHPTISPYMWKGYSYNYYITTGSGYGFRKLVNFSNKSRTLLMNDGKNSADHFSEGTTFSYYGNLPNFSDKANYSEWTSVRHSKKTNVLFMDGHAALNGVEATSWGFRPTGVEW